MSDSESNIKILERRRDIKGFAKFLSRFESAIRDGYTFDVTNIGVTSGVSFSPRFSVVLSRIGEEDITVSEGPLEGSDTEGPLEGSDTEVDQDILNNPRAKKADLLLFAESTGISVDESAKTPSAIKKVIKASLGDK